MLRVIRYFVGALLLMLLPASSINAAYDQDRWRAATIYNFTKFITWPEKYFQDATTFNLCVIGEDSVTRHLAEIRGKKVGKRLIAVKVVSDVDASCQILVVESKKRSLAPTVNEGVLTIGQGANFIEEGGMLAIDFDRKRIVFDINLSKIKQQGLQISGELLNLARSVK